MQLELQHGAKVRKESYLRVDREYCIHESDLMEEPDRKTGVHLRVKLDGQNGMEGLRAVIERGQMLRHA
jgi:hypothetical protein